MKHFNYFILLFFIILLTSVAKNATATAFFQRQNIEIPTDTIKNGVNKIINKTDKTNDKVEYAAKDSTKYSKDKSIVYLYGKAKVKYTGFELEADYIRYNSKTNVIFASGLINDKGKYIGRPIFKMDAEGSSIADSLEYNTKTGKGVISGVYTAKEGGFFSGGKTKMQPDNEFHINHTTFSTCNLPHPHFGIFISKGIAAEKQIITGPVYLKIEDIPMPIGLPFAFFPKPNKKSSGFILPTPGEDATRGFSLTNGGYYFAFNDYVDVKATGNIFTNGSYDVTLASTYTKRYKYSGNVNLSYSATRVGLEGTPEYNPQKNFRIGWTHSQNANAKPGTTFSASVNAGTSGYQRATGANNTNDFRQITANTLNSSIAYGKNFSNGINFTAAFRSDQETQNKTISITLPQISLNVPSFNPFDSKNRTGEQKWYQKINLTYSLDAGNSINSVKENLLFSKDGLKRFNNGFKHSIPIGMAFTVLKYAQFNANVNYNESWYFKTIRKSILSSTDSLQSILTDTVSGFSRVGSYSLAMGVTTKLFAKKEFKNLGNIKAIRHVLTPRVGLSFNPDFTDPKLGSFKPIMYKNNGQVAIDKFTGKPFANYSIFEQGSFGGAGGTKRAAIDFGIDNIVELKVGNKKDTAAKADGMMAEDKKIPILQGLGFTGSYNFLAKDKKLSQISFTGNSQLTDKIGFNFNGTFSPYTVKDVLGANNSINRIETNEYTFKSGKLPRLINFTTGFNYSLNPEALKGKNEKEDALRKQNSIQGRTAEQSEALAAISRDPNAFVDFNIPWNLSLGWNFNYSNFFSSAKSRTISNAINFNGDFSITPKTKIQFNSGIDLTNGKISPTNFAIYRDLHCWDMSINWVPFGFAKSYSVDIRVKASILQDLKLSRRRFYDGSSSR